jgi:hypothetical protein
MRRFGSFGLRRRGLKGNRAAQGTRFWASALAEKSDHLASRIIGLVTERVHPLL